VYDQNPALKMLVILGVFLGAYYFYGKPGNYAPPDDPWFRTAVLDRPGPVLVKFGAPWCGPCRMTDAELAQLPPDEVVKIDVGEHPALARHYGVSAIPRMLLFKDGKVVGDRVGYAHAADLQAWIDRQTR
jgi:thioredoxin 1